MADLLSWTSFTVVRQIRSENLVSLSLASSASNKSNRSGTSAQTIAGILGAGILIAVLVSLFLPSHEDRMVTAAKTQVLSRLSNPESAAFAEIRVAEERVKSWTSYAVQGCVKERSPSSDFPIWRGFSVEGGEVSFRSLYCPFLP